MRLKHALIAACLVAIGGAATACGNDDPAASADAASSASADATPSGDPGSAPTDSSAEDFCTGLTSTAQITDGKDVAAFAADLETIGTPSDITPEARDGFQVYVTALEDIDDGATRQELKKMGDLGLSKADQQQVQAFLAYAGTVCAAPSDGSSP